MGTEIDLTALNTRLFKEKRLFLPGLEDGQIVFFQMLGDKISLQKSSKSFFEPDPAHSERASLSQLDAILVPGLCFDKEGYRLGYGLGHYDRFLARTRNLLTLGVGFKEQLSPDPLPRDPWDIPVQKLELF
jgi:5-formyltetrahydrofolate cyclo-ligase